MMIKKSFYAVESIVDSLINDEVLYPDMRNFCGDGDVATSELDYCAYGFDYQEAANFEGYEYAGPYKFAALLKERLNVKSNDEDSEETTDETGPEAEDENAFYPVFFTSDGIKWDLTGTKDKWESEKEKVGTFDSECKDSPDYAGCGVIKIDVDTSNDEEVMCTAENEDCDTYEIQILANGKLRINPDHARAVNYATINTAIKDQ